MFVSMIADPLVIRISHPGHPSLLVDSEALGVQSGNVAVLTSPLKDSSF